MRRRKCRDVGQNLMEGIKGAGAVKMIYMRDVGGKSRLTRGNEVWGQEMIKARTQENGVLEAEEAH